MAFNRESIQNAYKFEKFITKLFKVHNFTISYHRKIRSKGSISSILDNVEGIGEIRKKELLKKYKTITKLKEATIEELDDILVSYKILLFEREFTIWLM